MSKTQIVKQGDTLSTIALENGFRDFHTIFDHPNNAKLKATRDPHVLLPGDKLFIPDLEPKTVDRATGSVHKFVVAGSRLFLRLKLLDVNGKALASTPCDVALEAGKAPDPDNTTDANGILEASLDAGVRKGEVTAHVQSKVKPPTPKKDDPPPPPPPEEKVKFDLRIGHLNPEFKLSGQQARLNNLGFFAGFTLTDLDQLLWAAEEFACEKISKPVSKRPKIEPAPPEGEDDETKVDPKKPTGIKEAPIFNKIKQEHGI